MFANFLVTVASFLVTVAKNSVAVTKNLVTRAHFARDCQSPDPIACHSPIAKILLPQERAFVGNFLAFYTTNVTEQ